MKKPRSFEDALERFEKNLLEHSFYAKHLKRWLEYFNRSQLLIIFYDDICDAPEKVLAGLYSFIGVDSQFKPLSIHRVDSSVREGTSPKSAVHSRIHSVLYDQLNQRIYHPLKELIGTRHAIQIKESLKVRQIMEHLFQKKGYPEMNPQTRAMLRQRFAEEIKQLSFLTRRDLNHWT